MWDSDTRDYFALNQQAKAQTSAREAQNNLLKSRAKWDSERALLDKLDRIEAKLDKLLGGEV